MRLLFLVVLAGVYSFLGLMDDLRNWDIAFGAALFLPFEIALHLGQFIFFIVAVLALRRR